MLLHHLPHLSILYEQNSHSHFPVQFSWTPACITKHQESPLSDIFIHPLGSSQNSPNTDIIILSRLLLGCEEPVSSDWSPLSLLGVTHGSAGEWWSQHKFNRSLSPQACCLWVSLSVSLGVKVCISRAGRQHWGYISRSTGLTSPVLFSRTHSSLSLAGSTHCSSWSTGSIVWTNTERNSSQKRHRNKNSKVFSWPVFRWCLMSFLSQTACKMSHSVGVVGVFQL